MATILRSVTTLGVLAVLCGFSVTDGRGQSVSQYASGWTASGVDWTPAPPSPNPLGPPDPNCTGTSNAGEVWAQFTFPGFGIPASDTIVGIEVNVNYRSVVSPTMTLRMGGGQVGASRALPATPVGPSTCNDSLIRTAGGPMDTWGAGLTPANFNSAGTVAVRLTRVTGPDSPVSIDIESIQLVVYHQGANSPPVASCQDVVKSANASCQASVTAAEVDNGSSDPDGDALTLSLSPAGPYSLGNTSVTLTVDDGQATDTCTATITVEDNTPPVISLTGGDVTLECGVDTFTDPGYSATDNCDGSVPVTVGGETVDPSTPGVYTITYDATDAAGNAATQQTRTVTVEDTLPPVITLNGDASVTLECGVDSYVELGATAVDACDGSVAVTVGGDTVDAGTPGTYVVTYDASDAAGNDATQVTRTVTVQDTLPPVIACNAPDTIIPPDAPISFTATAEDACAGPVAASVTEYDCFWFNPAGKRVDKTKSCEVSFAGDTVNIDDSGGVKDTIEWGVSADDGNGNTGTETCSVEVVNPSAAQASNFLNFPQFGSGDGFVSELVLQNPSESTVVSGWVRFFNPEGGPLEVGLTRSDNEDPKFFAEELEFSLAPLGSLTISAGGEPEIRQGSVTVGSDGELGGLIRFTVPDLGTTTVTAGQPVDRAVLPVRRTETVDTGVAVRNTEEGELTLFLSLRDEQGLEVPGGVAVRTLAPGARLAAFLKDLFPGVETAGFRGDLLIRSLEGSFVAVGLEVGRQPGEFTALPVTPVRQE